MKSHFRRKPDTSSKSGQHHTPGPCLNCGAYLWSNDLYCPKCGQKRLGREDMSFSRMIGESFLDYFHFDSKFFKTIFPLIFKPGQLTLEYMQGKRKYFVEPFRLFLVISIIYFLILPLSRDSANDQKQTSMTGPSKTPEQRGNLRIDKFSMDGIPVTKSGQDSMKREIDSIGLKSYADQHFAKDGWAIKLLKRQSLKISFYSGQSFNTVLEHTASKMIFLLIPVFALLLKLLYFRSKRLYYEHLIFSLHVHALVFLLLVIYLLIGFIIPVDIMIVVTISMIYLFFAIKRNYAESIGKSLGKFFLLIVSYCIMGIPVFFMLLVFVSIFLV